MNASSRITEALMRDALRGSGTTVWEWDVRDDRLSSTDDSAALLGYAPGEITDDQQAWNALIHPDDRAENHAAYLRHAAGLTPLYEHEYRALGKDGAWHWLIERGRVVERDAAGEPLRVVGVLSDITDRRALQEARTETLAAQAANQAKTEFLSRMSHELRTPLNGILGFAQLMALDRHAPLAPDQQRRLDNVVQAGSHLLALINDVLDLARIEHQRDGLVLGPVDAAAALARCLALIAPLAEQAGVRLPPPPNGPARWVRAEPRALEQVLMNLLSNAIKYNRRGGAVHVDIESIDGHLRIDVRDEGAGLSAEQQSRLFQHFERLGAETSGVPGSGLGLVITRELVQAMGAALQLRSTPGEGSTFSVVLAASPTGGSTDVEPAQPAAGTPPETATVPRCVLYIEDEPLNALLMQEVFRLRPAWTLHIAGTGCEGLERAAALRPDLLLIDMNLPDMNGAEVVQRLRAAPATAGLRCIALSADVMAAQITAARAAGFDDYWTKPIDVREVLGGLQRVFG